MNPSATSAFAPRVLRRWRDERLRLQSAPDGTLEATFRFAGSTCGNIEFELLYHMRLSSAADGHRLLALTCAPAPGDEGHQRMCSYMEDAERILGLLRSEAPLLGQPLRDVLDWKPAVSPAGCVCAATSRAHKWLAALHTLYFALTDPTLSPSALPHS